MCCLTHPNTYKRNASQPFQLNCWQFFRPPFVWRTCEYTSTSRGKYNLATYGRPGHRRHVLHSGYRWMEMCVSDYREVQKNGSEQCGYRYLCFVIFPHHNIYLVSEHRYIRCPLCILLSPLVLSLGSSSLHRKLVVFLFPAIKIWFLGWLNLRRRLRLCFFHNPNQLHAARWIDQCNTKEHKEQNRSYQVRHSRLRYECYTSITCYGCREQHAFLLTSMKHTPIYSYYRCQVFMNIFITLYKAQYDVLLSSFNPR